ncbi:squalene cyclase [Pseudooceanicola sp. LIPI14-2-Ac024]|uniref:squalene cyclase n=1 Tax=Pseudooceanicola sp. LIPI14-2-Ac024 TaxID=3344875 RepID=UPI0035D01A08
MTDDGKVIDWLMQGDPAIRWQVMRDLFDAPEADWQAERARVETHGWGARLLACQDSDGLWAGGAFAPADFDWSTIQAEGQPWTATTFALTQLRDFGLDPGSERAAATVDLVGRNAKWEEGGQPFWQGEVEECINGRTVADGAYFGVDVAPIVARLVDEVQPDGGWNCERCNGSVKSSFASTINVLEGLLEFERATGGTAASRAARRSGEDYLLARGLYRQLGTGALADDTFLKLAYPLRWRYDVLRALDHFRASGLWDGADADPRLRDAITHLRLKRREDGTWAADWVLRGRTWFEMEPGPGQPSRWLTLRALRVLRWWDESAAEP